MGPLRGDGNSIPIFIVVAIGLNSREDGAPSWGRNPPQVLHAEIFISREDGVPLVGTETLSTPILQDSFQDCREDGSPSRGTETINCIVYNVLIK